MCRHGGNLRGGFSSARLVGRQLELSAMDQGHTAQDLAPDRNIGLVRYNRNSPPATGVGPMQQDPAHRTFRMTSRVTEAAEPTHADFNIHLSRGEGCESASAHGACPVRESCCLATAS